jgi:hypothetical protein
VTDEEFLAEYTRLAHAVQSGVAFDHGAGSQDGTPKHLRTGLNCVMADLGSVVKLLLDKGVITKDEYFAAILDGLRREIQRYEQRLTPRGGIKITLG